MRIEGIAALCDVFGCSHQAVAEWQEQGMPVTERGGPNRPSVFDSVAVHEWLTKRAVDRVQGESQRDRVFRLQGDQLEMQLAKERGRLIDVEEVEPKMRAAIIAAREGLLRERRRLAALLDGVSERSRREAIIGETHEAFLRRLAAWRSTAEAEPAEEEAP